MAFKIATTTSVPATILRTLVTTRFLLFLLLLFLFFGLFLLLRFRDHDLAILSPGQRPFHPTHNLTQERLVGVEKRLNAEQTLVDAFQQVLSGLFRRLGV